MTDLPAVVLEPAAQQLVEATADPLLLIDAGPDGARKVAGESVGGNMAAALAAK